MLRNVLASFAILTLAVPCLAQVPPLPCSAPGGGLTVRGRIMDPPGGGLDGVACCDVLVVGWPGDSHLVRTRADGTFETCFACVSPDPTIVSATAGCCSAYAEQVVPQCADPLTGLGVVVDLGEIPCSQQPLTHRTAIQGSVLCRSGALLEPVVDCAILIETEPALDSFLTRTDANGRYERCVECEPNRDIVTIGRVMAQCCGESQTPGSAPCPERFQVGTMICDPCPVPPCNRPQDIEIRGRLTCGDLDGDGVPDPLPGCAVRLVFEPACGTVSEVTVTTDPDGHYSACTPCPLGEDACGAWFTVQAIAACCSRTQELVVEGCPPVVDFGTQECCPVPPCAPGELDVRGRVTCLDAGGSPQPVPGCVVAIICLSQPGIQWRATTDLNGDYSTCLHCLGCSTVLVDARCCHVGVAVQSSPGCPPVVADISCGACSPPPNPCGPSEQAILGRVTCRDAGGQRQPISGCDVRVDCVGGQSVTVTTDGNGDYIACLPCRACSSAIVTPLCCNSPLTVQLDPASCLPIRQDVDCGACAPPRPCPGPPATLVSGALVCAQNGAPLANSVVTLQALDAAGNPLPGVTTTLTDGAGQYRACTPCPNGIASIRATSQGCNVTSQAPAVGCPETLSLGVMLCATCSPCPAGSTRLQGRIQCRGGGPVGNCAIRVVVTTCNETLVFGAQADAQGKYKLCVPCPCDDTDVRVTALCCNASRAVHVDRCGPITPLPTIYCASPCR